MLEFLGDRASNRKLRLFACGCCRAANHLLPDAPHHQALDQAERHADGTLSDAEFGPVVTALNRARRKRQRIDRAVYDAVRGRREERYMEAAWVATRVADAVAWDAAPDASPTWTSWVENNQVVSLEIPPNPDRLRWRTVRDDEQQRQAAFVRCVFGNPFRPVPFDPSWRTSTADALACSMYSSRDFTAAPILADALEDAGCDDDAILKHLRGENRHVRGCWVVDAVMGKE